MRKFLIGLSIFCFLHILRDFLQLLGIHHWFTEVAHVWHAPQYEIHGIIFFLIVGLTSLYFALRPHSLM